MSNPSRLAIGFSLSATLLLACGSQTNETASTGETAVVAPTPHAEPTVDLQPASPTIDAAPPAPVLGDGQFALDLDGDGKDEVLTITPANVKFGDESFAHGMAGRVSEGTQPTGLVVDVDGTDNRQELIVRLTSYDSLAYNVLVYMREGKLMLSMVIYTRNLEALGDGRLHADNWFQGARTDEYYHFEGNELTAAKSKKKRKKKRKKKSN